MVQTFSNIGECNDYIEFLEIKGNPIPDWVKAEKKGLNERVLFLVRNTFSVQWLHTIHL